MAAPIPLQMQSRRHPSASSLHLAGKAMVRRPAGEYTYWFPKLLSELWCIKGHQSTALNVNVVTDVLTPSTRSTEDE